MDTIGTCDKHPAYCKDLNVVAYALCSSMMIEKQSASTDMVLLSFRPQERTRLIREGWVEGLFQIMSFNGD